MRTIRIALLLLAAALTALAPISSALAGKASSPEAADQTLGMAILSAVVGSDALLVEGRGAVAARDAGNSVYIVTFNRDVRSCAHIASFGGVKPLDTEVLNKNGTVKTVPNNLDPNEITVQTTDLLGSPQDLPFHLLVFCIH